MDLELSRALLDPGAIGRLILSRRRLLSGPAFVVARIVTSASLSLLLVPIAVHKLGLAGYGYWAAATTVIGLGAVLDSGLRTLAIQRVSVAAPDDQGAALDAPVASGMLLIALSAPLMVMAQLLVVSVFASRLSILEITCLVAAPLLVTWLGMIADIVGGALVARDAAAREQRALLVGVVLTFAVSVALLYATGSVTALALGALAGTIANLALRRRLVRAMYVKRRRRSRSTLPQLFGIIATAIAILPVQIANFADYSLAKYVLTAFSSPEKVAQFQIASQILVQGKLVAMTFIVTSIGAAITERTDGGVARFISSCRFTLVAGAVIMTFIVALAPNMLQWWLGQRLPFTVLCLQILGLSFAVNIAASPLYHELVIVRDFRGIAASGMATIGTYAITVSILVAAGHAETAALWASLIGNGVGAGWLLLRTRGTVDHLKPLGVLMVTVPAGIGLSLLSPVVGSALTVGGLTSGLLLSLNRRTGRTSHGL
jgi:O-antigen/teichoic acid export membrane protein